MNKSLQPVKDVVLAITYQCNSHCQFCHIWQKKQTFSCLPQDYNKLPRNIENVNISGGEPFLRKDLPEIIKVVSQRCSQAKIIISTNGLCPQAVLEQMPIILKIKKDIGVAVSLDGLKEVHEKLRGTEQGFDKAFATIQILRNLDIQDLKIAFTLSDDNTAELPKVYQLSKSLGLQFSLAVCHNSEHFFQKQDNQISRLDQAEKAINWLIKQELKGWWPQKKWLRAYFAFGAWHFLKTNYRILPDYSGLNSLFIDPFGQIYPSDVWNLPLGQLQDIDNWYNFLTKAQVKVLSEPQAPANWMICTARQAIKKHKLKVGWWILKNKLL